MPSVESPDLQRLQLSLREYAELSGKTDAEVLAKKGRDLGIQLFRGFRQHKFGGSERQRGQQGVAWRELRQRTAAGLGTRVRPSLLQSSGRGRSRRRINARQEAVRREVAARQRSRGYLAASFLWFRRRDAAVGRRLVRNRSGRPLGYGLLAPEAKTFQVAAFPPGLVEVDRRHGVVRRAIRHVMADMAVYTARKHAELARNIFRRRGIAR